jgi:hypothetical protein
LPAGAKEFAPGVSVSRSADQIIDRTSAGMSAQAGTIIALRNARSAGKNF